MAKQNTENIEPEKIVVIEPEKGGDVGDIVDNLLDSAPGVSDHVIAQEQQKAVEEQETAENHKGFDPEIHATDENGQPIPRIKNGQPVPGEWQRRRGKRKGSPGNTTRPEPVSQLGNVHTNTGPSSEEISARQAGVAAAHMVFQAGQLFGGDEWAPIINAQYGVNEPAMMEKAFGDYFVAKGVTDFPPGVALAIALVGYAGPRFTQPKTKTRLQKFGLWLKEKFPKKRKAPQAPEKQDHK